MSAAPRPAGGAEWPPFPLPFPAELLARLRAVSPQGAVLRLGLWTGESLTVRRVVAETDQGVVGELFDESAPPGREAALVAVPWFAIARVEAAAEPLRRLRGFTPRDEG